MANDTGTAPLINGNTIKCLTTTSPLTYTDVNNKITVVLNQSALETTLATNFYNKTTADNTFYTKTYTDANFYNKTTVDNTFYIKTFTNANFYNKATTDSTFYNKTTADSTFYTQSQASSALVQQANSSDVYTKSVIDNKLLTKQGTLVFTDPTGGANLGSNNNVNWVKGIKGSGPIAITSDNVNDVVDIGLNQTTLETTLASNFYKKTTADATFYNKTNVDLLLNGKQDALTRVVDINAASLLSSQNIVKALTTTSPLTYTDVNDKVTVALNQTALETTLATNFYNKTTADSTFYNKTSVNGLLALKQDALQPAAATGAAQVLSDLKVVKCLTTTSPVTFTDVNDKITIGLDMSATPSTLTNPYWIAGQIGADGVTVSKRNGR